MKITLLILSLFVPFASADAINNQSQHRIATIVSPTAITQQPLHTSKEIAQLNIDDQVSVYKRERAWYQVNSQNRYDGWLKMLSVRFIAEKRRDDNLGVAALYDSVVTRQILPTSSTGVRGFDQEDVKKASANTEQLNILLLTTRYTKQELQKFTKQGQLKRINKIQLPYSEEGDEK